MRHRAWTISCLLAALLPAAPRLMADDAVRADIRADQALARYGLTGKGVIVAILDRGIQYDHPDFIKPDGNTRIKALLDMTGETLCVGGPRPVEYSEDQINAALHGGPPLDTRDAVGHGTVTTGLAAGNGRAAADGRYAGLAPEADLLIVKLTSEGAPEHDGEAAEAPFQGCIEEALNWVDGHVRALGEPCVALIDSGTQWGPMDGTSAVSRQIDQVFGLSNPGRVYVAASGDEGGLPTHARVSYGDDGDGVIRFEKTGDGTAYLSLWNTGAVPAEITVAFDSGEWCGPAGPDQCLTQDNIAICTFPPGQAFYPWESSGPDSAAWIQIAGPSGPGTITIHAQQPGSGTADVYHADDPTQVAFTDHLAAGRLTDYATTRSAVVAGCYVVRDGWTDVDGVPETFTDEGSAGMFWAHSAGGPARDGRAPGVDICAPGENSFAAYARNSWWATFRFNEVEDGEGWYGRHGATSASAPIVVGAVALMLQMNPRLTAAEVKEILHATARSDAFTGAVPNNDWGYGKLDLLAALDAEHAAMLPTPDDAARALRIAAGLLPPASGDFTRLDVWPETDPDGLISVPDAATLARRAAGAE